MCHLGSIYSLCLAFAGGSSERYVMTPQHWLDIWSSGMLNTLRECKGLPTIVIDSAMTIPDIPGALTLLLSTLKAAGASHAVITSQPIQRSSHPKYCFYFLLRKNVFTGSEYPKTIQFNVENKVTGHSAAVR